MKVDISNLKRLTICPILYSRGWDYSSKTKEDEFLYRIVDNMFAWYARKGRRLSYDMLCAVISNEGVRRGFDRVVIANLQLNLKRFTKSGLYSKIDIPAIKTDMIVNGRKGNVIEYCIPALSTIKDRTVIILHDNNMTAREDLAQSYEAMICSVWSFYSLNRYPTIYNLYNKDDELREIKFTPNQNYIRESKRYFLNITEGLEARTKTYVAPYEICTFCCRRDECKKMTTKRIKQKIWSESV